MLAAVKFIDSIWTWVTSTAHWTFFTEKGQGILGAWSSTASILTFVAGIIIWLFMKLRAKKQQEPQQRTPFQELRNRERMLERVQSMWIEGVLEQSLYHIARIELGLKEEPESIEHPWTLCIEQPEHKLRSLPHGVSMVEIFDQFDKTLLLLGAPGSGKTTLLLELARDLIKEAEQDQAKPIPVIFNLSSWAVQRSSLVDWLVDELIERYDVPQKVARAWIKQENVLPLLDGLDEVADDYRDGCVGAINTFHKEHGLLPLVVCSRYQDYAALTTKLRIPAAVTIQPLTHEQVDRYLAQAGKPLEHLRTLLANDNTLLELLDNPLMLAIMQLAFSCTNGDAKALQIGTLQKRRSKLFNTYIAAMFARRSSSVPYPPEQTIKWLSRLALYMRKREQTVFYLEQMQPYLLPNQLQAMQKMLFLISVGIIFGFVTGLIGGQVSALIGGLIGGLFASTLVPDRKPLFFLNPATLLA